MSTTAPVQTEKSHIPSIEELGFDPAALRRKYDAERDKRMRSDGNEQYREVVGDLRSFVDDPYIESKLVRDAIVEDIEVAVIGGGFGGLLISARLLEAGITNFRIIEKAGDFGGTWYMKIYARLSRPARVVVARTSYMTRLAVTRSTPVRVPWPGMAGCW